MTTQRPEIIAKFNAGDYWFIAVAKIHGARAQTGYEIWQGAQGGFAKGDVVIVDRASTESKARELANTAWARAKADA